MEKKYLIVNSGSASKKYALYEGNNEVFHAHFERGASGFIVTIISKGQTENKALANEEYASATDYIIAHLISDGVISDRKEIAGVGLRVVSPGTYFLTNRVIDDGYVRKLEEKKPQAPLHITPIISEIAEIVKSLPNTPIAGISDSAFHVTMNESARYYGIPMKTTKELDMLRFGYHGISVESILAKIKTMFGQIPHRTIICHLGGGSSITALRDGRTVDTSMGFTPLEGLPMATRVGDIDPGAAIYLGQHLGLDFQGLESFFNTQCGLLGLSGETDDVRELLALEESGGDQNASLALGTFVHRVKKYIGAYFAALNGLDLLVFSGTIGERSHNMRGRICENLEALGVVLDKNANEKMVSMDGQVQNDASPAKIAVIVTNEMGEIARQAIELIP